jgi:hypothetical protein
MQEVGYKWDTQQENCYTKPAITNIVPVTSTLGSMNVAAHWNVLGERARFFRKKYEVSVACVENRHTRFPRVQAS